MIIQLKEVVECKAGSDLYFNKIFDATISPTDQRATFYLANGVLFTAMPSQYDFISDADPNAEQIKKVFKFSNLKEVVNDFNNVAKVIVEFK